MDVFAEVVSTLAYFALAGVMLTLGFVVLDLLTPGKLHRLVFVGHLPNAGFIAAAQQIATGIVVATAVHSSASELGLGKGLIEAGVFGLLGIALQAAALVAMELAIPGRFRDIVEDKKLRAGAIVASVSLVMVGVVNAACLT